MIALLTEKACSKCGEIKEASCFSSCKKVKSGLRSNCKECCKKYRNDNLDVIREKDRVRDKKRASSRADYRKNYHNVNAEKIAEKKRGYYEKNKPRIRAVNRVYVSKKRKNDALFAFRLKIIDSIRKGFVKKKSRISSRTLAILGCDFELFRRFIELKFKDGMSWDNYGDWELDHIVPIASAKTESDVILLNHYLNFQPLWKEDNRKKSARIEVLND